MVSGRIKFFACIVLLSFPFYPKAQVMDHSWRELVHKVDSAWLVSDEAKRVAENVLLYQRDIGGWPKNMAMHKPLSDDQQRELLAIKSSTEDVTIDNGATFSEMVFLSKMYQFNPDERYKTAFVKGLDYLLDAQYENGGWPQFYPLRKGYYSHITFNDDAMINVLRIMKEISSSSGYFSINPSSETIKRTEKALQKGIDCILKTQYRQNGVLTAWCAQHDEKTLLPAKARAYELPSLSGKESAQIVLFLMSLPNPSEEIKSSIKHAVVWFEKTKISGVKEIKIYNEKGKIIDKKLVKDETAGPLWARFMELKDNSPFFCDRDGIKRLSYDSISMERKTGYAWYTDEPEEVLKKYPKWVKKFDIGAANPDKIKKEIKNYFVVAQDGSGDYTSIQEAINNCSSFPYQRITIFIKNGLYREKVKVHEWNTRLTLLGESKERTIISWDDYFGKMNMGPNSTFYTPTLFVEGDEFMARNLTIENTAGEVGQAVALSVFADKVRIENCRIIGNQDTLYASGDSARQYYKNCYIEGTTDFVFGRSTAFFESCVIHSKKNSYITAAATPEGNAFGYVFKNCILTADTAARQVYLGRPWRIYAKTVFIDCEMGDHIRPEGWHNWSKPEAEKTAFYAEYNSKGPGANPKARVAWSHQLKKKEAKKYTRDHILGKGWIE
jgi:pectinesterase